MTYMNAEMELVKFAAEDVLATSNDEEVVETTQSNTDEFGNPVLPEDEF